MNLHIRLFAGLVDALQMTTLMISTEQDTITVREIKTHLIEKYPHAINIIESSFFAVNQAYAHHDVVIRDHDEVALIPPVSGGQSQAITQDELTHPPSYEITYGTIDVEHVTNKVMQPSHGATLTFIGSTREFTQAQRTVLLEYEAYVPMALKMMAQIGQEITDRWPNTCCAMTHRLGKVDITEISVVIAVSSPHREQCYLASRYAIDRLKQVVPIWKKEHWEDGSTWKGHQQGPWNPLISLEYGE